MPNARPDQRVFLVTGAARGLGASIARALGAQGYGVAVNARPGGTDPGATVGAISASGGSAKAFAADAFVPEACEQLIANVIAHFGRLDGLVLAATPEIHSRPFTQTTYPEVRGYLDAYIVGPIALVKAALPAMIEGRSGRVVAILTSALTELPPRKSAYISAKAGLMGLCRALAIELAPLGVTVNSVSPGALAAADPDEATRAKESISARSYPMRRLATHDDVVQAVVFFCSESAAYVSGANLAVTGGLAS